MYYEINISLDGMHFFATHKRSAVSENKMKILYSILKEKFPLEEGYEITVKLCEERAKHIDMDM